MIIKNNNGIVLRNTIFALILLVTTLSSAQGLQKVVKNKINTTNTISDRNNIIVIEAENFTRQEKQATRSWYLVTNKITPKVKKDPDHSHSSGASGLSYLELLPDTWYNKKQKKVVGKNFSRTPGEMAVLNYEINFKEKGRYYVWVRAFANNGFDNSIHVGVDGKWPTNAKMLYLCEDKMNKWSWSSSQFVEEERCTSKRRIYIDIDKPGKHNVMFSMREDGFEFDKWMLTKQENIIPEE